MYVVKVQVCFFMGHENLFREITRSVVFDDVIELSLVDALVCVKAHQKPGRK